MKNKEVRKRNIIITAVAFAVMLITIPVSFIIGTQARNEKLLNNTPLKYYTFWNSLDNYPKYKLEAAKMVEDLMNSDNAVNEQEACTEAINLMSEKIYTDTVNFFLENENADYTDYQMWVEATQR